MSRYLADIQREFAAMLVATQPPAGCAAIYHNNRRANFRKALALTYPVTARIVGTDFFGRLADEHAVEHPSRHGDLHHAGRHFAGFVGRRIAAAGSAFEYLADLARLEWAWAEALVAADAPTANVEMLRDIDPAAWPRLRLELQPAAAVIVSAWPIHSIFTEHRREEPAFINLHAGGECVAVVRNAGVVEAHRLSAPEGRFWRVLQNGGSLVAALDAALELDAGLDPGESGVPGTGPEPGDDFDLGLALGRMFATGAVSRMVDE
jgi:hypothetical protein